MSRSRTSKRVPCTGLEFGRPCKNLCCADSDSAKKGTPRCKHHPLPGLHGDKITLEGNEPSFRTGIRFVTRRSL